MRSNTPQSEQILAVKKPPSTIETVDWVQGAYATAKGTTPSTTYSAGKRSALIKVGRVSKAKRKITNKVATK